MLSGLDDELLRLMESRGFIKRSAEPFTLKSGILSRVYVSGRADLTDHPDLLSLVGRKISVMLRNHAPAGKQACLIGIPTAGTTLAQAASMVSFFRPVYVNDRPIIFRQLREVQKGYGAQAKTWLDAPPDPDHAYYLIDNVATNGDSKFAAAKKLEESGYPGPSDVPMIIFIDRQQGAVKRLKDAGCRPLVIYNLLDIAAAMVRLGFWDEATRDSVAEEIHQHQFV